MVLAHCPQGAYCDGVAGEAACFMSAAPALTLLSDFHLLAWPSDHDGEFEGEIGKLKFKENRPGSNEGLRKGGVLRGV